MNKKANNAKKRVSTANLFFACVWGVTAFSYFFASFEKNTLSKTLFLVGFISVMVWILFKYPLIVKIKNENLEDSEYDNIYFKNIGFWSCLYIGFFDFFLKQSDLISLFSGINLKLRTANRRCKFIYIADTAKLKHRFCDIILTVVSSVLIFFFGKAFSKYDTVFGIVLAIATVLFVYRKVFLNYIYSVNVGKHEGYRLNVMYNYNIFDGIFSNIYGLAYDSNQSILLHRDVYCGGDILKNYILAHEEGHLLTKNRKMSFFITVIFVISSFLGIAGPTIISDFWPMKKWLTWIPTILYFGFLLIFNFLVSSKNNNGEFKADRYAVSKIGKDAVLDGLKIIKNDNLYRKSGMKISGTSLDRRIEFIEHYNG